MLPPGHWRLKLQICRLFHANICKFDAEIKSYKDGKTIWIYQNHYLPCTYNSKRCRYMCNCYYYDRAVHISVVVDMRTLLDRNNFCSRINGQVAARRVTGLIIKRLWYCSASLTLDALLLWHDCVELVLPLFTTVPDYSSRLGMCPHAVICFRRSYSAGPHLPP